MKQSRSQSPRKERRSGLAAVEFALTLPLLMILVIGSIEASNAIFLRQAITIAAYETAQIASAYGGTEIEAKNRGTEILNSYQVKNFTIAVFPPVTAATIPGSKIQVTITAPSNSNSIGPAWFFKDSTFERKFTMYRL
ncbi:MAG: pilus assembly protein [Planctomicrobium sp.]|jgi:Flp pilus assembly protein TadG|nr:pilus assembly protein [Planctomicrobium sp.]